MWYMAGDAPYLWDAFSMKICTPWTLNLKTAVSIYATDNGPTLPRVSAPGSLGADKQHRCIGLAYSSYWEATRQTNGTAVERGASKTVSRRRAQKTLSTAHRRTHATQRSRQLWRLYSTRSNIYCRSVEHNTAKTQGRSTPFYLGLQLGQGIHSFRCHVKNLTSISKILCPFPFQ